MKKSSQVLQVDLKTLLGKGSEQEIVYAESTQEEEVFHQNDLIELEVYGISLNPDPRHPILLLKDKSEKHVLTVMINQLEAGVTLTQSNMSIAPVTPHKFAQELLTSLDIEILQCVFVQIKGAHQYVRIYFKGHPRVNSLKLKAEEVMSLVLHLKIPIFATRKYIEKSKILKSKKDSLDKKYPQIEKLTYKNQSYVI